MNDTTKTSPEVETGSAGQLFEGFLKEQGTYEATTETAVKRVLAFQLAAAMKADNVTKKEMAKRLETSRSQLDRLLDPENDTVTLSALARVAKAVGRGLRVELV
ncbi:MAG: helix-turn-helix transcriptional regulator [Pseudomonadota bacterium]